MNQTLGIPIPRCGSLAMSARPDALLDGATTQLFEPMPARPMVAPRRPKPVTAARPLSWSARRTRDV